MAEQGAGGIAWTEQTWNPIRGCSRVSEGCRFCYAETVAARFSDPGMAYAGLAKRTAAGPRWTGEVRLIEEHLLDPLRWTRPRRIFVNSMSDLFHEKLTDDEIARVFSVMAAKKCERHTFQVLTKRAARMRRWVIEQCDGVLYAAAQGNPIVPSNIWLGVSVENQAAAEERIPELLGTPAAVRWLSVEPQIGPVDLSKWLKPTLVTNDGDRLQQPDPRIVGAGGRWEWSGLNWVVIGGESGPGARPFEIQWARDLVAQCKAAGVAVFVKQLGTVPMMPEATWREEFEDQMRQCPIPLLNAAIRDRVPPGFVGMKFTGKGGDPAEWPPELRVREYPGATP